MSFTEVQLMQDRLYAKTSRFQKRITETHMFIDFVLSQIKSSYVACSFGKDSIVMLHLILQHRPNIPVYSFSNMFFDFPDTHRLRWDLQEKWNLNLIIREYNFKSMKDDKDDKEYNNIYFRILKEEIRKHNWDCAFVGKRKEEAHRRKQEIDRRGAFARDSINGMIAYPLADWTIHDIWAYSTTNNLPHHDIYDKQSCGLSRETIRLGVMFDPHFDNIGEQIWMKKNYPGLYNQFVSEFLHA